MQSEYATPAGHLIAKMRKVNEYARQVITECPDNCDEKGKLKRRDKSGEAYVFFCPLLSKDCRRGMGSLVEAERYAAQALPKGIPKRYREEVLTAHGTLAFDRAMEWNRQGVMYITGPTGSGKSFTAAWYVYRLIRDRLAAEWNNPYKWRELSDVQMGWFSAYQVILERVNLYAAQSAGLLILDDLGAETPTPQNKATLLELIGQRYNNKVPTIITSNLDVSDLLERYSQRFYDRVMHGGLIVHTGDRNWRVG